MPLTFSYSYSVPYEVPKVLFFQFWIKLLLVFSLPYFFFFYDKSRQLSQSLIILMLLFLVVALSSSFLGVDFTKSFIGNYYRQDGLITLFHLFTFTFFIIIFWRNDLQNIFCYIICVSSSILSLWLLIDSIKLLFFKDLSIPNFSQVPGISFGNPNFLGGYLLISLPFTFYLYLKRNSFSQNHPNKLLKLCIFSLILQTLAIILTRSWGAILGLILFYSLAYLLFLKKNVFLIFSLFIVFIIILFISFFLHQKRSALIFESRERIVRKLILGWLKKPVFGYGWANVDYAFKAVDWPVSTQDDIYLDKAHSHLLELLVTTGLIGFLTYFCLIVLLLRRLTKISFSHNVNTYWNKTLLITLILFLFHSQTNIISINQEIIFWLILGIGVIS